MQHDADFSPTAHQPVEIKDVLVYVGTIGGVASAAAIGAGFMARIGWEAAGALFADHLA